jgi:hypothetical protein
LSHSFYPACLSFHLSDYLNDLYIIVLFSIQLNLQNY